MGLSLTFVSLGWMMAWTFAGATQSVPVELVSDIGEGRVLRSLARSGVRAAVSMTVGQCQQHLAGRAAWLRSSFRGECSAMGSQACQA
mmetsp:Transcript_16102/g.36602  ORF Transcript_16102/g.36602 Transcript_16102/m.36602 type:complete len:88 (+) Transcript_16102:65-328(+)